MARSPSLKAQAKEILKQAEENGVQSNYFFRTTFQRYQTQLTILDGLEKSMKDDGLLITKEYVKGRANVYSHPAVADYNKTTDSANKTVATLMRILKAFGNGGNSAEDDDPLLRIINGDG